MMMIPEIYNHFGLAQPSPPHCFTLENIAELFIPEDSDQQARIMHLLPLNQTVTVNHVENFIKSSWKNQQPNQSADISVSEDKRGALRFHILSANERNETEVALKFVTFFIDYMSDSHV